MLNKISDHINKITRGAGFRLGSDLVRWKKVAELTPGVKIAVPTAQQAGANIEWDEIVSITKQPAEQVWDIEVDSTHNFVANDIVAHNTTGKALAILNETGDQALLVASAGGARRFLVANNGDVTIGETSLSGHHVTTLTGQRDVAVELLADTDDAVSGNDSPSILFSADNVSSQAVIGISGDAGTGPKNNAAYTNSLTRSALFGTIGTIALQLGTDSVAHFTLGTTGNVGIGTTSPIGKLHTTGAVTGKALTILNETGDQNILAASAGGTTQFTLSRAGVLSLVGGQTADITSLGNANLTLSAGGTGDLRLLSDADTDIILPASAFTGNNSVLYTTASTGVLTAASTNTTSQCLVSGASAPSWATCPGGSTNWWTQANGTLYPINSTLDLLIGGTASSSAKFAFLNVNSGTPVASISGNLTLNAAATIATTNKQSLTVGDANTGVVTVGSGTGDVQISLTGEAERVLASKTVTLSGVYGSNDFSYTRTFTGGTNAQGGSLLYVTDTSGGSGTINPDLIVANSALTSGTFTGNLLRLQVAGSDKFKVDASGNAIVANGAYLGLSASTARLVFNDATRDNITLTNGDLLFSLDNTWDIGASGATRPRTIYAGTSVIVGATTTITTNSVDFSAAGTITTGGTSDLSINAAGDDVTSADRFTIGSGTAGNGQLTVTGAQTGKALTILNETGNQDILAASVSGANKFVIRNSGSVGIGTTTPGKLVEISGSGLDGNIRSDVLIKGSGTIGAGIHFNSTDTGGREYVIFSSGTGGAGGAGKFVIGDITAQSYRLVMDSNGQVVIGAGQTTPTRRLNVVDASAGTVNVLRLQSGNSSLNDAPGIEFFTGSNNEAARIVAPLTGSYNQALAFYTQHASGTSTEKMRISALGNIGIGTTAPISLLHTEGKVTGKALTILNETGNQNVFVASVSGATKFVIDNSGNVGIGTPSLGSKLFFSNNLATGALDNYSEYQVLLYDAGTAATSYGVGVRSGTMVLNTDQDFDFDQDGSTVMTIVNGNVGIGTTAPLTYHSTGSGGVEIARDGSPEMVIHRTTGGSEAATRLSVNTNKDFVINVKDGTSGSLDVLTIDSTTGNVGIGTTAPISLLHTEGKVTGKALTILNETGNQSPLTASVSGTTAFVVDTTGKIGVGPYDSSTVPRSWLSVLSKSTGDDAIARLTLERNDTAVLSGQAIGQIDFYSRDTSTNLAGVVSRIEAVPATDFSGASTPPGANTNIVFRPNTGNAGSLAEAMRIQYTGQVSIGTTSPLGKLTVEGKVTGKANTIINETGDQALLTASVSGTTKFTIANTGDVTIVGSGTTCTIGNGTGATNCTSDVRLKENITDLGSTLDKIRQLRPITFDWIDPTKDQSPHTGLIAQEVERVFPDLVHTVYQDYKGIDYAALVVPTLKGLQELDTRVSSLAVSPPPAPAPLNSGVAENFPTQDQTLTAGEIVAPDTQIANRCIQPGPDGACLKYEAGQVEFVARATAEAATILGITTSDPGINLGQSMSWQLKNYRQIAVAFGGKVRVKVASDSPSISAGDYLTTSASQPGRAAKSVRPGPTLGTVLESWTPGGGDTVLVSVNPAWSDPNRSLAFDESGNLSLPGTLTAADVVLKQAPVPAIDTQLKTKLTELDDKIASMSAELANLKLQLDPAATLAGTISDSFWTLATESGKLLASLPVQVSQLTVTGRLQVGLLTVDDIEASLASLTGVVTIKGDLAVTGTVTAAKYAVDTTDILGASLGKATIPAGATDIAVETAVLSPQSAIFVTPEREPVPVSTDATESGKFVIRIPQALTQDLKVNWWIIN